jgi:protein tyrosine phosphatase
MSYSINSRVEALHFLELHEFEKKEKVSLWNQTRLVVVKDDSNMPYLTARQLTIFEYFLSILGFGPAAKGNIQNYVEDKPFKEQIIEILRKKSGSDKPISLQVDGDARLKWGPLLKIARASGNLDMIERITLKSGFTTEEVFAEEEVKELFADLLRETCEPEYNHAIPSRFNNVLCPKENALSYTDSEGVTHFVHANSINVVEGSSFIAAQVPEINHGHFWAVAATKTNLIVDLTRNREIDPYYPMEGTSLEQNGVVISCISREYVDENTSIFKYIVQIGEQSSKEMTRIRYKGWEDHSLTAIEDLIILIDLVNEYTSKEPPMVHCRAGVGRTGTFIAAALLLKRGASELDTSDKTAISKVVSDLVLELRKVRGPLTVQSEKQYKLLLQVASKIQSYP